MLVFTLFSSVSFQVSIWEVMSHPLCSFRKQRDIFNMPSELKELVSCAVTLLIPTEWSGVEMYMFIVIIWATLSFITEFDNSDITSCFAMILIDVDHAQCTVKAV